MDVPKSISDIKSGRMKKDAFVKKNFPEFYCHLIENYPSDLSFSEKLYWYFNNISEHPKCEVCGKPTAFVSNSAGYSRHCSTKCTQNDASVRKKMQETCVSVYGEEYKSLIVARGRATKEKLYGDPNYNNPRKTKKTMLDRYGADNPQKCEAIREKTKATCIERYGAESYIQSEAFSANRETHIAKIRDTLHKKYGVESPMQLKEVKDKVNATCLDKYGVMWNCMRKEAHNSRNSDSKSNLRFADVLDRCSVKYEREYPIDKYTFDFRVGDTLIELNPSATHNVNFNPFSKTKMIDKNYHKRKTDIATEHGFRCIHVWDWDDLDKIADILCQRTKLYARNCKIRLVSKKESDEFLISNHLQGTARKQKIRIALVNNDRIVELMTFGKPRYNKNFEWELIRLCSERSTSVIGGASKLFKYFIDNYSPTSVVSYCDLSKFTGNTYKSLGMKLARTSKPSCMWVNLKTKERITDNELRRLGADNILGTEYGKGTNNADIMIEHNWVQVYNCGQNTYIWKND